MKIEFSVFVFMLVLVGCQKSESMEDFDALFTHTKSVLVKDCLSEELIMGRPFYMIYADSSVIFMMIWETVCLRWSICQTINVSTGLGKEDREVGISYRWLPCKRIRPIRVSAYMTIINIV